MQDLLNMLGSKNRALDEEFISKFKGDGSSLSSLNSEDTVIVIGRGHSGTRLVSKVLCESGVFMGEPLNESYDLVPPNKAYSAVVNAWNDRNLQRLEAQLYTYLKSVVDSDEKRVGWKLPEMTLLVDILVEWFPKAKFVVWCRNPWDVTAKSHITDNLMRFMVGERGTDRLESWLFQYNHIFKVFDANPDVSWELFRFEDYVLDQESEAERLGEFLGLGVSLVEVDKGRVNVVNQFKLPSEFSDVLGRLGY